MARAILALSVVILAGAGPAIAASRVVAASSARARVDSLQLFADAGNAGVHNIIPTRDGGYLVLGTMVGADGTRDMAIWKLGADLRPDTTFGNGGRVVLGSSGDDQAVDAAERIAPDGTSRGYWVVGQAGAGDRDFAGKGAHGKSDLALIRLSPSGAVADAPGRPGITLIGGDKDDEFVVHHNNFSEPGRRILPTGDGHYYLAAQTESANGDFPTSGTIGTAAARDALIMRIDDDGRLDSRFGHGGIVRIGTTRLTDPKERTPNDFLFSLAPSGDGGVVASGYVLGRDLPLPGATVSTRGNLERNRFRPCDGGRNCYVMDGMLVRVDALGRLVGNWGEHGVRFFGGSFQEKQYDLTRDDSGGYLFVGRTSSNDLDLQRRTARGDAFDAYIGRLTPDGELDRTFGDHGAVVLGGPGDQKGLRVLRYAPGAYAAAIETDAPTPSSGADDADADAKGRTLLVFFDSKGRVFDRLTMSTPALQRPVGMALTHDGRIILAGVSGAGGGKKDNPTGRQAVFVALVTPPAKPGE